MLDQGWRGSWRFAVVMVASLAAGPTFAAPPPGYVDASLFGYNSTDATNALQTAIDTGSNVYVPNMGSDWIVKPITLTNSNQVIRFEDGVVVSAKAGEFTGNKASLFTGIHKSNVSLIGEGAGATFRMRKDDYLQAPYSSSEHRHGINLGHATNFHIEGLRIEDTGGDGIYVGATNETNYSENVTIKDVIVDNNYRQGISVISVDGLLLDNVIAVNTSGTVPQSGLDFEPNYTTHRLDNITVRNSIFMDNGWAGILFVHNPGNAGAVEPNGMIENVTVVGNAEGIRMYQGAVAGMTIRDSLIVDNSGAGFHVSGGDGDNYAIEYSALWSNGSNLAGDAVLGAGSITGVEPIFASTDINDPFFMYLDPATAQAILEGASDDGYMGARPVVPEPATGMLLLGAVAAGLFARRRPAGRNHGV